MNVMKCDNTVRIAASIPSIWLVGTSQPFPPTTSWMSSQILERDDFAKIQQGALQTPLG